MRQDGEFPGAFRPGLIMLDLNLPRRDGLEVLAELKADPALRVIPVVILTTSRSEEDVLRSYALHANAYVSKPVEFERFMDGVCQIDNFFVTVVRLPGAWLAGARPANACGPCRPWPGRASRRRRPRRHNASRRPGSAATPGPAPRR